LARKILLADDSVTAQNMGRKILADAGYEVIAVNNGSAALKKIAELKPDLVILDVYMPGYSGLEVCQRLKESQETARIPVLLTVGKLEPFKPEEAQRVRAEGYIVKPFEASELLSALSKLEDKVVPRAEASKPGRFARAIAAAEDTDRGGRKEPSSTETGWKSRIGFPAKKAETDGDDIAEEMDDATQTVAGKKDKRRSASPAAKTSVDMAALAPAGVPKDVTSAEVAAITAAAAQIQIAGAAARDEHRIPATSVSEPSASEATSEFSVEPALERFQDSRTEDFQANSGAEAHRLAEAEAGGNEPAKIVGVSSELPAADLDRHDLDRHDLDRHDLDRHDLDRHDLDRHDLDRHDLDRRNLDRRNLDRRNGDQPPEETQNAPVTMAATSESSRWTAVPVALGGDETSMSLDHEMQKAYAAFAAADYATSAGTVECETAPTASALPETKTNEEAQAPAISNSEPTAASEPQPTPAEANIETSKTPDFAKPDEKLAPVEFISSARDTGVANPAPDLHAAPATQPPIAQSASASTDTFAPIPDSSEPKLDSEAVKTTAAAWASWRQVRDTGKTEEPQPQESTAPESPSSDTAALAVAAGAEQALQESSSAAPNGNPTDVASIVDSVLAGLRPKLMEEITRKMAEKK
jgi:two-component system chemotaxis response regulator CheY